jgi:predicted transcriptional regulator
MYAMRRTTIFIEDALLKRIRQMARREGKSFAAVVRESLAAYASGQQRQGTRLPRLAGRFASGRHDTAERVDELLWTDPHQ